MDKIIEILSNTDWVTILAFLAALWIYNKRLDKKFEKIDDKFQKIDDKFEKLDEKIEAQGSSLRAQIEAQGNNLRFQMDKLESNLNSQMSKLDEKVTDIDRRLCRLEGAFTSKDCCMLKEDRIIKKAE